MELCELWISSRLVIYCYPMTRVTIYEPRRRPRKVTTLLPRSRLAQNRGPAKQTGKTGEKADFSIFIS